jgi:hypothetical protein
VPEVEAGDESVKACVDDALVGDTFVNKAGGGARVREDAQHCKVGQPEVRITPR